MIFKKRLNRDVISFDPEKLAEAKLEQKDIEQYFPQYILHPSTLHCNKIKRICFGLVKIFLEILVWVVLRPRAGGVGELDPAEVQKVYSHEAQNYEWKHHLTTRGMDLVWRRFAGWVAVSRGRAAKRLKILDLCTGTGLVIKDGINPILRQWNIEAEVIGMDCNSEMLQLARESQSGGHKFLQGDATKLVSNLQMELVTFEPKSFDLVTQVFGLGGINKPLEVFGGVLQVLKPGGAYLMVDMHKPILELPGEWPFLHKWWRLPTFEMFIYEEGTIPVILHRLWGWRDTTPLFYLLPLVTHQDEEGQWWGFRVVHFEQESYRWWFALPVMPVGKIIAEKVKLEPEEAENRRTILEACTLNDTRLKK